ncbi:MAG TPA: IS66 family transposase [Pirellulaceae bacterium]|nr:IS66 family transposase [Pirellulaceae bacterium]
MTPITLDIVEAYSLCPRKACLLLSGKPLGVPHEYVHITDEQAAANRVAHGASLAQVADVSPGGIADLKTGAKVVADAELASNGLHAHCDFLTRVNGSSRLGRFSYEPVKAIGTCHATRCDTLGLAYQGLVLGEVQGRQPSAGTLVLVGDHPIKVKLAGKYKEVRRIVEALRAWTSQPVGDTPPVILNKHCPSCPFRDACLQQAEKEDNLSLLDRMTPKQMRKYHDKGIFTVRQLSHIYKPRRSRKKAKRQVRHSLELQALAIRTGKVHVEHLPELPRSSVELFLDLEGVPDRDSHYLAGLLVCRGGEAEYESFWADDASGEAAMWSALIERLAAFPDSPVYHYGSYEKKAFATLAKRHGSGGGFSDRLVNVASSVYGKVYFPVRSNGLKPLGRFVGAAWTDPQASGLQSLVWRHRWEMTRDKRYMQSLLSYNREDCEAVRLLVDRLDQIRRDAASDPTIEFASRPKRHATETGKAVHGQFERILKYAEAGSAGRGVRIREKDAAEGEPRKRGAPKGHQAYQRISPAKVGRTVTLPSKRNCPRGHGRLATEDGQVAERTVIDLVFTRNGCRKTITRYTGKKGYCLKCALHYLPPSLDRLCKYQFGHGFQAWTIYQRVVLRLPYRIITQVMEHLFGVGLSASTVIRFLKYLAGFYTPTEAAILQAILKSDFVHVDETKINIQGVDHYVWVFTDGQHVVFRMTETREAEIVREVLAGYQGVLVSDFYPGYDAIPCRQQKCLVHLIRDINDDLWKAPFDRELETFAVAVQALLVPILVEIDRYGLKAWHLRKFLKDVERFYDKHISGREYTSEPVRTFQKRFDRYRESLFTFLTQDGIPWENNMAERAIRQLAVQRKISQTFFKRVAPQYLMLLAISQTCRFQGKSFLKFLLSKAKDVDEFRRSRPIKYSAPVGVRSTEPAVPRDEGQQLPGNTK